MNVIDVLAILPYYVSLFLMGEDEVAVITKIFRMGLGIENCSHYIIIMCIHDNQVKLSTTTTVAPIFTTISPEDEGTSFDDVRRIIQGAQTI